MSSQNPTDYLEIKLASPETILKWSHGEVKNAETVNYRTLKPEVDGLFCERIFGPTKNYQCAVGCRKYNKEKDVGTICEECGVEVAHSRVRRERMGHIKLTSPIVHFWYFKRKRYVQTLLDMTTNQIENIIYCKEYVVLDPGDTSLERKQLLSDEQYEQAYAEFGNKFRVGKAGAAIKELLEGIDLDVLSKELKEEYEGASAQRKKEIEKKLSVVEDFRQSGNRPEWMVLEVLPVLPADLRPIVQLDGGRFATTDLNELYRRIINRNNRLVNLKNLGAPSIIEENELRMLQTAVDALIDNKKNKKPVTGQGNRVLKSLSTNLEGKSGRFRQNLLGKRVDYSGRSVITVGPELQLHECGIPREMALELFKPFVLREMYRLGYADSIKKATRKVEKRDERMWDVLEKIVKDHPVLLNRAPTLHKLSIMAFMPKIIEGKSIELHPLVCAAYNADFDGDQMAVHVPLSREAQVEARVLMMSTKNLSHPQNGKSSVSPSQDMVLGCYYLSIEKNGAKGEGKYFPNMETAMTALENGVITLHTKIIVNVQRDKRFNHKYVVTTPGKIIFNEGLPDGVAYVNNGVVNLEETEGTFDSIEEAKAYVKTKPNKRFDKGFLGEFATQVFNKLGDEKTPPLLDSIKEKGFKYSTMGGMTISLEDIVTPDDKWDLVNETREKIEEIEELYQYGRISEDSRHDIVTSIWGEVGEKIKEMAVEKLNEQENNPIQYMLASGARGTKNQFGQLAAARMLMADPTGKTIERPVLRNFKEGLDVFDYFISSHGARKGMADTALKTADSGYLTRKLVDVAHDVVVKEDDCGTNEYMMVKAIDKENTPPTETLKERIVGRTLGADLEKDGVVKYKANTLIDAKLANQIASEFEEVPIRTVLTCETEKGVCRKCYGYDLTRNREVEKGEAVGVIAAQSIGEPGTQLTMRTFHSGGVAGDDITTGLPRVEEIFESRKKIKGAALLAKHEGEVKIVEKGRIKDIIITTAEGKEYVYEVDLGVSILVEDGEQVELGQPLTKGPANAHELLRLRGMKEVQKYLLHEVQRVYRSQGVKINDKHVEIIIRQITKKVQVTDGGDSDEVIGSIHEKSYIEKRNKQLKAENKQLIEYRPLLMSITKASLSTDSFLSAASFQETPRILSEAAVKGKIDRIEGLKEAVILGRNIPAGTGFYEYLNERRRMEEEFKKERQKMLKNQK